MKMSRIFNLLPVVVLANGCVFSHHRSAEPVQPALAGRSATPAASSATLNPIVTPDNSLTAKVAAYNSTGRFVVLTFPVGPMPAMNDTLFLYRSGLKAGEVQITGPQQGNNIVADLVTGTAQVGDEVREQ